MAQPILSRLRGTLTGETQGGRLPHVAFDLSLSDQDTHDHVVVTVENGDVLKPSILPVHPQQSGTRQTLFVLIATGNVQVRLNANSELIFNIGTDAPLIIGGLPEITQLHFTSLVALEVKASITKVFGTTTLTDPSPGPAPSSGIPVVQEFTATAGQTTFTLANEPSMGTPVRLNVEGVLYTDVTATWFTVTGTTLTWNDVFVLPLDARVNVTYYT